MGKAAGIGIYDSQMQTPFMSNIWNNTEINTDSSLSLSTSYIAEGRDYEFSTDNSASPQGYSPLPYPHPYITPDDTVPRAPGDLKAY